MTAQTANRVQQLVKELLATRLVDLGDTKELHGRLQELNGAVGQLQVFVETTQSLSDTLGAQIQAPPRRGRPPKDATKAVPAVTPSRAPRRPTGKRGPGEFGATSFILAAVKAAGTEGVRPRDIVAKVKSAAPGHHNKPSALVSTTLRRLKERGEVTKDRGGKWHPAKA